MERDAASVTSAFALLSEALEALNETIKGEATEAAAAGEADALQAAALKLSAVQEFQAEASKLSSRWAKCSTQMRAEYQSPLASASPARPPEPAASQEQTTTRLALGERERQTTRSRTRRAELTYTSADAGKVFEDLPASGRAKKARRLADMAERLAVQPHKQEPYYALFLDGQAVPSGVAFMRDHLDLETGQTAPRVLSGMIEFLMGERDSVDFERGSTNPGANSYDAQLAAKWEARRAMPRFQSPVPFSELIKDVQT